MVTMFRAAQADLLEPIMSALRELSEKKDWTGGFLVAERGRFNWATAPFKHYASFEDFYEQELAETWGKWSELQETYRRRAAREITDDQAQKRIEDAAERHRREMRERDAADRLNQRGPGRPGTVHNKKDDVNSYEGRPWGNSVDAALRRLRKSRPDLHARVLNGELSANAAMIEAGFRKPRPRDPDPVLTRLRRIWKRASLETRRVFLAEVSAP
jgi:hypothetical protein